MPEENQKKSKQPSKANAAAVKAVVSAAVDARRIHDPVRRGQMSVTLSRFLTLNHR